MSVLVTGGAGYIGSHMVLELLAHGEEVVVVDRLSTGFDWAVHPDATLIVEDVGDEVAMRAIIAERGITDIIHFAGSIVVPESVADPLGYYLNNTVKSRSLIAAAVDGGVANFIFSSTAAVYASADDGMLAETAPLVPASPYGRSKLMTEMMLADAANAAPLRYTALRYFNVAGADPGGRAGQSSRGATHLIKVACETALGKRSHIDVYGTDYPTADGTCIRDYIHVSDLVAAHYLALLRLRAGGASLVANCGYGRGYSVRDVLGEVARVSGVSLDIRATGRRPGDPARIVADSTLARRELGWRPEHDDLGHIIAHALAWEERLRARNRI